MLVCPENNDVRMNLTFVLPVHFRIECEAKMFLLQPHSVERRFKDKRQQRSFRFCLSNWLYGENLTTFVKNRKTI